MRRRDYQSVCTEKKAIQNTTKGGYLQVKKTETTSKVDLEVIKPCITKRMTEILGFKFMSNQLEVKIPGVQNITSP